jgi:RHS repeat-associated protein
LAAHAPPICPVCQRQAAVWYHTSGGQSSGPVTWEQLRGLAQAGGLRPEDRVCLRGTNTWQTARDLAGLFAGAGAQVLWYHLTGGRACGPVAWQGLRRLAAAGQLRPDDKVCRQGMKTWQTARDVAGLFQTAAAAPVVLPPPPRSNSAPSSDGKPRSRRRRRLTWAAALAASVLALGIALLAIRPPTPLSQPTPEQIAWQFEYDEHGALTRKVDPAGREIKVRYERDGKGRVTRQVEERGDGTQLAVDFDRHGRPVAVTNPAGTVRREYDGFGRLKVVRRDGVPALAYDYDDAGRVAALRVGDTRLLGYTYDFLGRLIRLETPAGVVTYEHPAGNNRLVRTLPNKVRTTWNYNPDGTLASLAHVGPDDVLLIKFVYSYRPDGLVKEVSEETPAGKRTLAYDYDALGRLTAVADSGKGKTTYRYDSVGNRVEMAGPTGQSVASACDWAGRLTQYDGRPCTHDAAGNLIAYSRGTEEVAFTHAIDGRLASARTAAGEVRYAFDGEGNLVRRAQAAASTSYLPDPTADLWRPLLASEEGGKQIFYLWQKDKPLGLVEGGQAQFFLENQQGSVRCVTDAAGKVVAQLDYDAFGVPEQQGPGGVRPGFSGLFYDTAAGVYLTRARAYDPALGRFLQRDPEHRAPAGVQEDLSAYVYCGNDAVNYIDANGCAPFQQVSYREHPLAQVAADYRRANNISAGRNVAVITYQTPDGRTGSVVAHSQGPGRHAEYEAYRQLRSMGIPNSSVKSVYTELEPCHYGKCDRSIRKFFPEADVYYSFEHGHDKASRDRGRQDKRETFGEMGLNNPGCRPPGPVGGIRLRGIGDALRDLGPLRGIALDANGRLVLLTDDKGDVALPPLRLEDVAVIFRAAYREGEAPYVSIDPDKNDAHGPTMDLRHSPGTEATYVGWILFEADRVMKAYSLGFDNLENAGKKPEDMKPLVSSIPGYRSTLDMSFDDPPRDPKDEAWARFWIVPASVTRRQAIRHQLTLLDVPLKVDTEPVIPKNGKLESVPGAKSRPSDTAFAQWFSEHFDDLAREVWSLPPPESGRTDKVPVFVELRRIALIAAVAERLRDQNVPLPGWIRDYPVQPFATPRTTPTITPQLSRRMGTTQLRRGMFGGAEMSPRPENIKTVLAPEADALAVPMLAAVNTAPDLQPVRFQHEGKTYQAVALPGDDTKALGACRMDEADLEVALPEGNAVRLERSFDSFHQPADVFGGAWTLDLPTMQVYKRITRIEDKSKYSDRLYQLDSPLGTYQEFFGESKEVPEARVRPITVARSAGPMLGAWTQELEETDEHGQKVRRPVVDFRDGRRWLFDKAGRLVERQEWALTIRYRRDSQGRLTRIEGQYGSAPVAAIDLEYDDRGQLVLATSSEGKKVRYVYDAAGLLSEVRRPEGVVSYRYRDGLVSEVSHDGKAVRHLEYTSKGEVLAERDGQGAEVRQDVQTVPEGVRITMTSVQDPQKKETVLYDLSYRPVQHLMSDGGRLDWKYEESGAVSVTVAPPDGEPLTLWRSADARQEKWRLPEGGEYAVHYDAAGRPTDVLVDGRAVQHREWGANGLPRLVEEGSTAYRPEYSGGVLKCLRIRPRDKADASQGWVDLTFEGPQTKVTEQGGMVLLLDEAGRPVEWTPYENPHTRERQNRLNLRRDAQGRVQSLATTWGYQEQRAYDPQGRPTQVTISRSGKHETVEFHDGRPTRIQQFDGGAIGFAYYEDGPAKGKLRQTHLPGGLLLSYEYNAQGRLAALTCGNVYRLEYQYDNQGRLTALQQVRGSQ